MRAGEYEGLERGVPDFMRPLIVWKAAWDGLRTDGQRLFGERYVLVRLEDLRVDPEGELHRIYDTIGRGTPDGVREWAEEHVRREADIPWGDDPRWAAAAKALDMEEALEDAGYGEILALKGTARAAPRSDRPTRTPRRASTPPSAGPAARWAEPPAGTLASFAVK